MPTRQAEAELAAAQAYRTEQLQIRAQFTTRSLALWPVLDKRRIGATSPEWLRLQIRLVRLWRAQSATAAARYYGRVGSIPAPRVPGLPDETVVRNLLHSGPRVLERGLDRGLDLNRAGKLAQARSARAGGRLVLSGGRDTLDAAVRTDPKALGWMRVTDGDPCGFCAMLASRGAVYHTAATAGGRDPRDPYGDPAPLSHYHDGCGCAVVPVFTTTAALPESSQRYADLWVKAARGLSGAEARRAFRRAVEAR